MRRKKERSKQGQTNKHIHVHISPSPIPPPIQYHTASSYIIYTHTHSSTSSSNNNSSHTSSESSNDVHVYYSQQTLLSHLHSLSPFFFPPFSHSAPLIHTYYPSLGTCSSPPPIARNYCMTFELTLARKNSASVRSKGHAIITRNWGGGAWERG